MNSLLKRQIRKYLSEHKAKDEGFEDFLDAINRSYNNFNEQYAMQQRAMAISSEELFNANEQLRVEAEGQKEVIEKLKNIIQTLGLSSTNNDISKNTIELNGLELIEIINQQTKKIIEINQELNDYAHMVSHDLKSPLRSIDTLTTWLKEDYQNKFDAHGNESLKLIRDHVEKMDNLISGILQYSTINKNQSEMYEVDINTLVDDILKTIHIPNHITITKSVNLPIVKGDKFRLQQLFQNLIVNAIKHNDKAEGVINIDVEQQDEFWQFSIQDNGKGIDPKYHQRIFKTFEKLDNNLNSSGIGLSIVKKIVGIYNGKIWVKSKPKEGANFIFTLKQ